MLEAQRDEKVIRQFREKISKKAKANNRRGVIRKATSVAAAAMVVMVGGTMYYYAKSDPSMDLKDMVRGAVETMGDGISQQVSDEEDQIPATLETEEDTTSQGTETTAEKDSSETKETETATEASTAQSSASSQIYVVRKGDTLVSISVRRYGTQKKVQQIKQMNNIKDGDQIYPGQKLLMPES